MKFEDFLSKSFVILDPDAKDQRQLFEVFASLLYKDGVIESEERFVEDLIENEKKGTTGIGQGIALPHLMMDKLDRSYIIIARLKDPIAFNSIDNKPVRLVILLLSAKEKREEYVQNLAKLARVLRREGAIEKLMAAKSQAEVISIILGKYKENFFTKNSRFFYFAGAIVLVFVLAQFLMTFLKIPINEISLSQDYLKFNESFWVKKQILACGIFFTTIIGTLLFWKYRVAIAAFGLGVLLFTGTIDLETTVKFMNIPIIIFLISMMVIISWLESIGVFKFLVANIVKKIGPYPRRIFLILMLFSGILGGLVDEVTGILVAITIAITICNQMNINPFPFVISLVFATNTASALTMIGNPIGIYIAFSADFTFTDFLRWSTPISFLITIIISLLLLSLFSKSIPKKSKVHFFDIDPWEGIADKNRVKKGGLLFLFLIILIGFSSQIDKFLHLPPNTSTIAIPLAFVGIVIFLEKENGKILVEQGVQWWSILFFMFLFANAACLEYTGVTPKLAYMLLSFCQNINFNLFNSPNSVTIISLIIITVFTAVMSGFVDNLPIIAALVPVVKTLKIAGLGHANILWWGLLFGGCLGGNLTIIGSSANMVAMSVYEKSEGKSINFATWIKYGMPVVIVSVILALGLLILQISISL